MMKLPIDSQTKWDQAQQMMEEKEEWVALDWNVRKFVFKVIKS